MKADAEAFLAKAQESLASAEADLQAGRFNSAVNRAYYSVFQAGVAILTQNGIKPRRDAWEHRFVISQVSGKLIKRRKVMSGRFAGTLDRLLKGRLVADYRPESIGRADARGYVREAGGFVGEIIGKLEA